MLSEEKQWSIIQTKTKITKVMQFLGSPHSLCKSYDMSVMMRVCSKGASFGEDTDWHMLIG